MLIGFLAGIHKVQGNSNDHFSFSPESLGYLKIVGLDTMLKYKVSEMLKVEMLKC